ncbi:hypothetical protein BC827DRAFT_134394 [Russula dissimulans]|nr:hypothetical protein BC827DRAFT_134394 [Russula dissimulans]
MRVVPLDEVVLLAFLKQLAFFAAGHRAVDASVLCKSSLFLTPTVLVYPARDRQLIRPCCAPRARCSTPLYLQGQRQRQRLTQWASENAQAAPTLERESQPQVAVLAVVRAALVTSQHFGESRCAPNVA